MDYYGLHIFTTTNSSTSSPADVIASQVRETMEKALWDGVIASIQQDNYDTIVETMKEVRDQICDLAPHTIRPVSSLLETNGCIGKPRFTEERTNIVYNANKHRKAAGLLPEDVAAIMIQTTLRAFELDGASIFGDAIEYP
ncbi:T-complex protein 11 [Tanacetum coccineum]